MDNDGEYTITTTQVSIYETTMPLLESMYAEFKELSKKKPEAPISKSKIKIVNRLLEKIGGILADEESIEFLDLIDEDDIPQTSDVTLMLSQYVVAMSGFKKRYYGYNEYTTKYSWFIGDEGEE